MRIFLVLRDCNHSQCKDRIIQKDILLFLYISQRYSYLNAHSVSQEFYQVQAYHRYHSLSTPQAGINHLLRK